LGAHDTLKSVISKNDGVLRAITTTICMVHLKVWEV